MLKIRKAKAKIIRLKKVPRVALKIENRILNPKYANTVIRTLLTFEIVKAKISVPLEENNDRIAKAI